MSLDRQTLQDYLCDLLRKRIGGACGFRLPMEKELAQEYNVTLPTLRKALRRLADEGLLDTEESRKWRVTSRARDRRVAILCDLDLTKSRFPWGMLSRIQYTKNILEEAGYPTVVYLGGNQWLDTVPSSLSCRQFIEDLKSRGFAGVICPWAYPHKEWTELLEQRGIPLVGYGQYHRYMVSYGIKTYVCQALQLLKSMGVSRIAWLDGLSQDERFRHNDDERLWYVKKWMREERVEIRQEWMHQSWHLSTEGACWSALREILVADSQERPEAVIFSRFSDRWWPEIRQIASSFRLRIPEDLKIVVPAEKIHAQYVPCQETIRYVFDGEAMAREAVSMLLDLIAGKPVEPPHRFVEGWILEEQVIEPPAQEDFTKHISVNPESYEKHVQ